MPNYADFVTACISPANRQTDSQGRVFNQAHNHQYCLAKIIWTTFDLCHGVLWGGFLRPCREIGCHTTRRRSVGQTSQTFARRCGDVLCPGVREGGGTVFLWMRHGGKRPWSRGCPSQICPTVWAATAINANRWKSCGGVDIITTFCPGAFVILFLASLARVGQERPHTTKLHSLSENRPRDHAIH